MVTDTPLAPQCFAHIVASPLVHALLAQEHLEFAVLVGSRPTGPARPCSDWDIDLQWSPPLERLTSLDLTEPCVAHWQRCCKPPSALLTL